MNTTQIISQIIWSINKKNSKTKCADINERKKKRENSWRMSLFKNWYNTIIALSWRLVDYFWIIAIGKAKNIFRFKKKRKICVCRLYLVERVNVDITISLDSNHEDMAATFFFFLFTTVFAFGKWKRIFCNCFSLSDAQS